MIRERLSIKGPVLARDHPAYEAVRAIWNGSITRRPAVIARCLDEDDVAVALEHARRHGLPLSVRGGGHNVAGTALCEGGLLVDLQLMKGISVDPARRRVRVQPGVLLGELDAATQQHGLAVPAGINSLTGVAGLTLGGGLGWLMRRHGLTCDRLVSARVVLADGSRTAAGADGDADLLWALRGGGGNFGIVTEFEFDAVPIGPTVIGGALMYAAEAAGELLRRYRDLAASAPDELTTMVNLRSAPPAPWIPAEHHGRDVVFVAACWAGDVAAGEHGVESLRRLGRPLADSLSAKPFTIHQRFLDATAPPGWGYHWKSCYTRSWSDGAIDTLVANAWRKQTGQRYTLIAHMGGAVRRVPDAETAFAGRDSDFAVNINAVWTDPGGGPRDVDWARAFWTAMEPHSTGGVYVNFLGEEGSARVRAAYGAKWSRLARLKARYDPENVFRANQNIEPDAGAGLEDGAGPRGLEPPAGRDASAPA